MINWDHISLIATVGATAWLTAAICMNHESAFAALMMATLSFITTWAKLE